MCSGVGYTCGRKELPFYGTIYRDHNKEPQKGRSFRLQLGFKASDSGFKASPFRVPGFGFP